MGRGKNQRLINLVIRECIKDSHFVFSQKITYRHHGGDSHPLNSTFRVLLLCVFLRTWTGVSVVTVVYSLSLYKKFRMHSSMNVEENNEHALHILSNLSGARGDDRLLSKTNAAWLLCHAHSPMPHQLWYLWKECWLSFQPIKKVLACADTALLLLFTWQAG